MFNTLIITDLMRDHIMSNSSMGQIIISQLNKGFYDIFLPYIKNNVVVDIGANVGLFSLYYQDIASRVISVEPTLDHGRVFLSMLDANKITNVSLVQAALTDEDKVIKFYTNPANSTMNSIFAYGHRNDYAYEVQGLSLETILKGIDPEALGFIKIDIEGSERELIDNTSFLEQLSKPKAFFVEIHATKDVGNHTELKEVQALWVDKLSQVMLNHTITPLGIDGVCGVKND
jgi:FkbM family methyltransferase